MKPLIHCLYLASTCILLCSCIGKKEKPKDKYAHIPAFEGKTMELGRKIYIAECLFCHETGREFSPVRGSLEDWSKRIEQDVEILYRHAIDGVESDHGEMPPKGGNENLTDEEVMAAVDYMLQTLK